jgi:hypothetical protein
MKFTPKTPVGSEAHHRSDRRSRSRSRRRRARIHRIASWLMDVQDSYSDTAR